MGTRGPKPTDKELLRRRHEWHAENLRARALGWVAFLRAVRDGCEGAVYRVEYIQTPKPLPDDWDGRPVPSPEGVVKRRRFLRVIGVGGAAQEDGLEYWLNAVASSPDKFGNKFQFLPPIPPCTEGWRILDSARTPRQVREAAGLIEAWWRPLSNWPGACWRANAIRSAAKTLAGTRRLPCCPRSKREKSRDPRLLFLAKVLAGSTVGLAPLSAIKRLTGLRLVDLGSESDDPYEVKNLIGAVAADQTDGPDLGVSFDELKKEGLLPPGAEPAKRE